MKKILSLSVIVLLLFSFKPVEKAKLKIKFTNMERAEGTMNIAVFRGAKGFPDNKKSVVYKKVVKVTAKDMEVTLDGIAYGNYAVVVLQDLNGNKEADMNAIGIPKEPFGFSNNPSLFKGKPDYDDVSFDIDSETKEISIEIKDI